MRFAGQTSIPATALPQAHADLLRSLWVESLEEALAMVAALGDAPAAECPVALRQASAKAVDLVPGERVRALSTRRCPRRR